jgi:hypothetical protein
MDNVLELVTKIMISFFMPIPLPRNIVSFYKETIVVFLIALLFPLAMVSVLLGIMIFHTGFIRKSFASTFSIQILKNKEFKETDTPMKNPLGGNGLSMISITAGFMDPNYHYFGGLHTGVDFVPNDPYYQTNEIFKKLHVVIVYATMNGKVTYDIDQYGSNTVEVINKENTVKTIFMHLNDVFVNTGQDVSSGTPIGTMGDTGFTTGEHLHYEIRLYNNSIWVPVNPLVYIE